MASCGFSCYDGIQQLRKGCYFQWMNLQAKHIVDLKEALKSQNDHEVNELVGKIVDDFQKYAEKRSKLTKRSCSGYVAPSWNSSLENGLMWMGGCRPSSFFRVVYSLSGSQVETQLSEYLLKIDENEDDNDEIVDSSHDGSMSELTAAQFEEINELHITVIRKEDKITKKSAHLQEDVADMPIAVCAYTTDSVDANAAGVKDALDKHEGYMAVLMVEADKLRVETLRKIVEVVTPVQAAEFLLAGKRLNVSLHEWGRVREEHGLGCPRAEDASAEKGGAEKLKRSTTC